MTSPKSLQERLVNLSGLTCLNCGKGHYEGYKRVVPAFALDDGENDPMLLTTPCDFCGCCMPAHITRKLFDALLENRERLYESDDRAKGHLILAMKSSGYDDFVERERKAIDN